MAYGGSGFLPNTVVQGQVVAQLKPITKQLESEGGDVKFPSMSCWEEKIYVRLRVWITSEFRCAQMNHAVTQRGMGEHQR